jgi:YfiH family protein
MLVKRAFVDAPSLQPNLKSGTEALPEVIYLQFPELSKQADCAHAVCTRHGGVSRPPYDTLNTGYGTEDRPERVALNIEITKALLGTDRLKTMNQVHGTGILVLRRDNYEAIDETFEGDAIITDMPGLAVMVKQADCQAVILYDPVRRVISNVHCGWRGNTRNILGSVVKRMSSAFGCVASDILAAVGPSLGPCCAEFITHGRIFPKSFRSFMVRENYFDLWELSRWQLSGAGLHGENIEVAGICTRCRTDLFYSYRAEGVTGRFATLVMLKED